MKKIGISLATLTKSTEQSHGYAECVDKCDMGVGKGGMGLVGGGGAEGGVGGSTNKCTLN